MNTTPEPFTITGTDDDLSVLLESYYWCGRSWEAWQYKTMTEEDFEPAAGCVLPAELIAWRDAAVAAERERLSAVIPPGQFRKLADWFDADDEFKVAMFPETWPERKDEVQQDLRRFADLLAAAPAVTEKS
jgi:hypothetical protein